MKLKGVTSGRVVRPRKILLYGVHGIGKSSFAAKAPNPIFIQTEEGTNDLEVDRFPLCKTMTRVDWCITQLLEEEHDYKTVVIDSADMLGAVINKQVCEQMDVPSIEDIPYGKGHEYSYSQWNSLLGDIELLQEKRDMTVIFIAHSKIVEFQDPSSDTYHKYTNNLHINKKGIGVGARIQEWCDEVLFANYKTHTRITDKSIGKEAVKAVGSGERVIYTEQRASFDAKNRLGLPYELPMDKDLGYQVYADYIGEPQTQTTGEGE